MRKKLVSNLLAFIGCPISYYDLSKALQDQLEPEVINFTNRGQENCSAVYYWDEKRCLMHFIADCMVCYSPEVTYPFFKAEVSMTFGVNEKSIVPCEPSSFEPISGFIVSHYNGYDIVGAAINKLLGSQQFKVTHQVFDDRNNFPFLLPFNYPCLRCLDSSTRYPNFIRSGFVEVSGGFLDEDSSTLEIVPVWNIPIADGKVLIEYFNRNINEPQKIFRVSTNKRDVRYTKGSSVLV